MDPREDDERPYDDSDDHEPFIRELQLEMVRLQAQIDQLTAAAREQSEEMADLRNRMNELEALINGIRARYRQKARLWGWTALCYGLAIGMWLSWLIRG
jgi:uncharacterized protein involved in exopolysaccharide biosynthesis